MSNTPQKKIALVTGGRTGIGAAIVTKLLNICESVIVTSRLGIDFPLNERVINIKSDVTDPEDRQSLLTILQTKKLYPNVLVNNVGHTLDIKDPECSIDKWHEILNLNLYTAVAMTNLVLPMMRKGGWGRIVNISSNAGVENSGPVTFSVSKAALTAYTRSMGRVLAASDPSIVMTAVLPGVVITEDGHWQKLSMSDPEFLKSYLKERCPLGRFGTVAEIAEVVAFYCTEAVSFSHGSIVPIDGGQSKGYFTHNYM